MVDTANNTETTDTPAEDTPVEAAATSNKKQKGTHIQPTVPLYIQGKKMDTGQKYFVSDAVLKALDKADYTKVK